MEYVRLDYSASVMCPPGFGIGNWPTHLTHKVKFYLRSNPL